MKILTVTLIAGIMLEQSGILVGTTSENSVARNVGAAKSFALGGIGVAGLMSEGGRNLRAVLSHRMPRNSYKPRLVMQRREAKLYILVGLRRCDRADIKKSSYSRRVPTMTLKRRADA